MGNPVFLVVNLEADVVFFLEIDLDFDEVDSVFVTDWEFRQALHPRTESQTMWIVLIRRFLTYKWPGSLL